MIPARLKVLVLAPYLDNRDVGEAHCAFRWVEAIAQHADVTLLTMERPSWSNARSFLPGVRVHAIPEPAWTRLVPRINSMAKLSYKAYSRWAVRVIARMLKDGQQFDVAHQLSPFALRHTSPLRFFNIPYVLGPRAGSLGTPEGLRGETDSDPLFMKARKLDQLRFRWSSALRTTYQRASLVMGAAPYIQDVLGDLCDAPFRVESELGINQLPTENHRRDRSGVRLLHVGRGVRSKGLRDVLQAISGLHPRLPVHLDVAGQGPEIEHGIALAEALGLSEKVTFHGQIPRDAVDALYAAADIFVFPSFREPSGSVIFEAMSHGLPIIGAACGGPGHVIDTGSKHETGILIEPDNPDQFVDDIARAIVQLVVNPTRRSRMGENARRKLQSRELWAAKGARMVAIYREVLMPRPRVHSASRSNPKSQEMGHAVPQNA